MALIQGITGGLSGKMGSAVFRQRHGKTVVTQYQPAVANPNSDGQVVQRAKFKLVSQLAAVLNDYAAIPRNGSVSGRNTFTKLNLPAVEAVSEGGKLQQVSLDVLSVKLTDSAKTAPTINTAGYVGPNRLQASGTLSVTVRRERVQRQTVTLVAVLIGDSAPTRPEVIGSTRALVDETGNYNTTIDTSISITSNSKIAIYAYGINEIASGTSEVYDSILSEEERVPVYFLDVASRSNFANMEMTATAAKMMDVL